MNSKTKIAIISALTAFSMIGAASSTIAWFTTRLDIDMSDNMTGESNGAYFAGGDGTSSDPFIINNPVHLYNLAWLQYLGYFNDNADSFGASAGPTYFELDENMTKPLDMTGWVLPPIGTTRNPFIGVFDGNGKTITNLTTINSSDLTDYPKKPYPVRQAGSVSNVNVLGMFGVVGKCNLPSNGVTPLYPNDYPTADGTNGYTASSVSNFYIDNCHVKNYQDTTIAGIAAGYVNASLSGVGISSTTSDTDATVKPSSVDLSGTTSAPTPYGGKTNISDFTSVGFCEDKYRTQVSRQQMELYDPSSYQATSAFTAEQSGDVEGWGGSIGMDEVFQRLSTFEGNKVQLTMPREITAEHNYYYNGVKDETKTTYTYTNQENTNSYEYYDATNPLKGRVTYVSNNQRYLWGSRTHRRNYTVTNEYHSDDDAICYYLKSGTYYFRGTTSIGTTQTETDKTLLFEDTNGYLYYKYNNKNYYLYANNGTDDKDLKVADSQKSYMFKIDGTRVRLYQVSSGGGVNRRIRCENNGNFSINKDGTYNLVNQTTDYTTETYVDHEINHDTAGSYLPLNVYKNTSEITETVKAKLPDENLVVNGAKLNNTGYIVGGSGAQSGTNAEYNSGVRIASNYSYSDISVALGGGSSYTGGNLQVLTRTKDSNGVVFIKDDYNKNTDLTTNLKNIAYAGDSKYTIKELGLQRYESSRKNLDKQFNANTSVLYSMRFNEFDISLENTIVADKVLLNGEVYENYVLPESCIDFNLKEKGFINFFGGSYRGGDCDAFFSLFHIIRDSNNNITTLKRLGKIYGTNSEKDPYVYQYADDNSYAIYDKDTKSYVSTTLPNGYSVHFDMKWVEEPGFTQRDYTCWYFEIPVNEGEYALGSAVNSKTSTGAYMFYLDVGANAANVYRSTVIEIINHIAEIFARPLGVGLVTAGATSVSDVNSYCITIKAQYNGVVAVSRESSIAATYTESVASDKVFLSYAYELLKVNTNETAVAASRTEENIKSVTYFDYTPNDDSTTKTVLSRVTTTTSTYGSTAGPSTDYIVEQYKYYGTEKEVEETNTIIVYNDQGLIITKTGSTDRAGYGNDNYFNAYTSPTTPYYNFAAYYEGLGTVYADIVLTTNKNTTDICDLFSDRGYSITIMLDNGTSTPTNITNECTIFPLNDKTYEVTYVEDAETYVFLLTIHEEYIGNLVTTGS